MVGSKGMKLEEVTRSSQADREGKGFHRQLKTKHPPLLWPQIYWGQGLCGKTPKRIHNNSYVSTRPSAPTNVSADPYMMFMMFHGFIVNVYIQLLNWNSSSVFSRRRTTDPDKWRDNSDHHIVHVFVVWWSDYCAETVFVGGRWRFYRIAYCVGGMKTDGWTEGWKEMLWLFFFLLKILISFNCLHAVHISNISRKTSSFLFPHNKFCYFSTLCALCVLSALHSLLTGNHRRNTLLEDGHLYLQTHCLL